MKNMHVLDVYTQVFITYGKTLDIHTHTYMLKI